tara:strand:+ start:1481 stop:1588 length:108 start_codon:yes stop_codon:yes gene_type:complete
MRPWLAVFGRQIFLINKHDSLDNLDSKKNSHKIKE